jgi:protein-disulfide isomerase
MRRFPLLACLLMLMPLLGSPGAARAADTAGFTPEQRQQIIQIVREALKNDPSILREAVESLQADSQAREAADSRARVVNNRPALLAHAGDPVVGNPQGDVTLVEFYDPRCPYCRRMLPAIADLLKTDPKIRLVYKDIPVLGPASQMETRAILAAQNQGGYEKMQLALMTNPAQPDAAMIRATAHSVGLDADRLLADMNSAAVTAKIQANLALARELKVDGTPVWVVGDSLITGAVDEAALADAIAEARGKKS